MIIRNKFNGYVNGNNRLYPGGGGGPTTTYSQTSNIPEYAQPYVERMMGATEKQVYTYNPQGDITGFQPYKPFEGETVAGFSPMQAQAMRGVQNYQLPGQTQAATNLTGYAGLGSMMAGRNYMNMATNPYATQAFMSPYMEGAVAPEMREAARQSAILGQQNQAQAVQQGAFGGARSGIVEAERQRNLQTQLGDIYGKGMQNAFQQAQQAQQFGSQLGLQGYGQGLQAAGQLGALGQQQYGQEMGLLGQQMDVGAKQQAYEQARLNQIVQNYATQQQYPFIQLGTLSNMLRGLPMQASTTQMYQAQPTGLQQGIGLAGAYANLKQAGVNVKEGGAIKEMASGGIATGVDPYKLPGMLEKLSDKQLSAKGEDQQVDPATKEMIDAEAARRAGLRKGAGIAQMANGGVVAFKQGGTDEVDNPFKDEEAKPAPKVEAKPKPAPKAAAPKAPAPKPDTYGGIVQKYLTGESAAAPDMERMRREETRLEREVAGGVEGQMAAKQSLYDKYGIDPAALFEKQRKEQEAQLKMTEEDARKSEHLRWAQMFAKFGSTPGPILKAALTSINEGIPDLLDDQAKVRAAQKEIKKVMFELDRAELLEKKGNLDEAFKADKEAKTRLTDVTMAVGKAAMEQEKARAQIAGELEGREIAGKYSVQSAREHAAGTVRAAEIHQKAEQARHDMQQRRLEQNANANAARELRAWEKENGADARSAETALRMAPNMDKEQRAALENTIKAYEAARQRKAGEIASMFQDANMEVVLGPQKPAANTSGSVDTSNPLLSGKARS